MQPRAIGTAKVSVRVDETGQTRIVDLRQSGSSKLVFPQNHRNDIEAILVNTAGGITGGDSYAVDIEVQTGASLTLTTQAAERAYRAQPGETGHVNSKVFVRSGANMQWLPQEMILFDRSALRRQLRIDLAVDAHLLMVEPVVFGRAAMSETLREVQFHDHIQINRNDKPIYMDAVRLLGDAAAHLARAAIANGAGAMASVVHVAPDAASHLDPIRATLPESAGASLLAEDILVIRHLASDSFELRRDLIPVLERLSQNPLPTSWRL